MALGLIFSIYSSPIESIPPVPQQKSAIEITFPSSVKKLSLPKNNISIQSLITSLGVYCSPAAEFSVNLLNISS